MIKKGIIVTPPISKLQIPGIPFDTGILQVYPLNLVDLRRYILYWDKIEVALCNQSHVSDNFPDEEMLIAEESGFLEIKKHVFASYGASPEKLHFTSPWISIFKKRNDQNINWTIGGPKEEIFPPPQQISEKSDALKIELIDLLPVFGKDVPIDQVIRFREKRNDELTMLRLALDELASEISTEEDFDRAKKKLEKTLLELNRVADEHTNSVQRQSVSIFIKDALVSSAGYTFMTSPQTLDLDIGTALGATAMMGTILIKNEITQVLKKMPEGVNRDFLYLFELIKKFK